MKPLWCFVLQTLNPRAWITSQATQIKKDLAQSPSAMSTLEVLQNFPTETKALLLAIECVDPLDSNLVVFSHEKYIPRLPYQLDSIIQVIVRGKNIHHYIMDEGASTCIMSMSC